MNDKALGVEEGFEDVTLQVTVIASPIEATSDDFPEVKKFFGFANITE